MAETPDQGQLDAHTQTGAALPGADPLDLLTGSPDLDASDLLALAAEPVLTQRRARGRPQGATNRKSADMIAYLASLGHRDPWVTLSLIQSADFAALCRVVGADTAKTRVQVLALVKGAAESLMNYHHSKKPQQLELPVGDKRPLMVIGDFNVAVAGDFGIMSAGIMPDEKVIENQPLNPDDAVRDDGKPSHE